MAHAVTLELPNSIYDHFMRRAEQARRTLEAELLDAVRFMASDTQERLPDDLEAEISRLEAFDDEALWQTARSHLPDEASAQLEALNFKQKSEGLTPAERESLSQLLYQYERFMLLRAHAATHLKSRGHDVSCLLAQR